ncbi:hypothetical protein BGZ54_001722 [Gamsiella multidivaricata]|nr:hypothetical protein BGZ54_001722 [Gamsiella multidivaricata]
MAQCYSSSGSAPLNALANQLLGESSFSAKASLFRSTHTPQHHQQHQRQHHLQGLFPRHTRPPYLKPPQQHPQKQLHGGPFKPTSVNTIDPFEQAWSSTSASDSTSYHHHLNEQYPSYGPQIHDHRQERYLPDLDLISAWEKHQKQQQHLAGDHLHQVQTTLSGVSMASHPDLSSSEYESFHYQPAPLGTTTSPTNEHSSWTQEWSRQQEAADTDDDDDGDDEFREEWSNDHFTQAYINSHQSQFRAIEEQDRLKEARLEEERERQRQAMGGPPRSAWMMAGSAAAAATVTETRTAHLHGTPRRLRVPGLDPVEESTQNSTTLSVDEFMNFHYSDIDHQNEQLQHLQQPPQLQQPRPVHAEDRFLSLVNDLHSAEQSYYPAASSATLPGLSDQDSGRSTQPCGPSISTSTMQNGWAQEFATENDQRRSVKYVGAEWNWEKLFGKDPRRQLQLLTNANDASAASRLANGDGVDEADRLRAPLHHRHPLHRSEQQSQDQIS